MSSTKGLGRRWLVIGLAVTAAVVVLLAWPGGAPEGTTSGPPAPDVAVPVAGGGEFKLADFRGQVVVLDFLAPGCPSCAEEVPSLGKVAEVFGDQVVVVVVDVGGVPLEQLDALTAYYQEELNGGDQLVVAVDQDLQAARDYQVQALGTTVIVDREGRIRFRDQTVTEFETMDQVIQQAQA